MTIDEIIRMAIKCQLVNAGNREGLYMDALAEFADLVAAAEREECAKVCDQLAQDDPYDTSSKAAKWLAVAIRAREQQ